MKNTVNRNSVVITRNNKPTYIKEILNDYEFILLSTEEKFIYENNEIDNLEGWQPLTTWYEQRKVEDGNIFRLNIISNFRRNTQNAFVFVRYENNGVVNVFATRMTEEAIKRNEIKNRDKITKSYLTNVVALASNKVELECLGIYSDDYLRDAENDFGKHGFKLATTEERKEIIDYLNRDFYTILDSSKKNKSCTLYNNYKTYKLRWS